MRGITLIPRKAAKLLNPNTGEVAVSVFALGTLLGYSQQNLLFIYKQFLWEAARGTSNVFKTYNNAFGMNAVNVRQTTQTGTYETSVETLGIYPLFGLPLLIIFCGLTIGAWTISSAQMIIRKLLRIFIICLPPILTMLVRLAPLVGIWEGLSP